MLLFYVLFLVFWLQGKPFLSCFAFSQCSRLMQNCSVDCPRLHALVLHANLYCEGASAGNKPLEYYKSKKEKNDTQ